MKLSQMVVAAVFAVVVCVGGTVRGETPTYDAYTASDGNSYIALGLQGPQVDAKLPNEVVFLVDTSASQTGQFRSDALAVVKETLQRLPNDTRVSVIAVDVQAVKLTPGLVAKTSTEAEAALTALQRRVPLGATNLTAGVAAAGSVFTTEKPAQRTVVYIGDGRNMATTLQRENFQKAVQTLTDSKAPFTVCALGPQVQYDVLGSLVNSTGGVLIDFATIASDAEEKARDQLAATKQAQQNQAVTQVADALASSTTATVVWFDPAAQPFPTSWEVFPKSLPPVRSDRETFVVARTSKPLETVDVALQGKTPSVTVKMEWDVAPGTDAYSNRPYLRQLFNIAASTDGEFFPIVGREMLDGFRDNFAAAEEQKLDAARLGQQVGVDGDAQIVARDILASSPNDKVAQEVVAPTTPAGAADAVAPQLVDSVISAKNISVQKLATEVSVALQRADKGTAKFPKETMQDLRLTMAMVRENASISDDEREQLLDKLGSKLKHVQREAERNERMQLEEATRQARRDDRVRALSELEGKTEKLNQIFNRYSHLMSAREYAVAEQVARMASEIVPNDPTATAAALLAASTKYIDESIELRYKRERGFVEGLQSVERSFIPVLDEPPITYPEADLWRRLSEHRKERWEVNDLTVTDPNEKAIRKMLDRTMTEFVLRDGATVQDLIDEIRKQNPRVTFNADVAPLPKDSTGEELTLDTELLTTGKTFYNMKLSTILKNLLSKKDAGYFIKDQVLYFAPEETLKVTTNRPVRVYNALDLSMQMGGMGGGMMGGGMMGGMNGMNGGMGGMNGGMGGMNGGMGGGNYGGMGGGMNNMGGGNRYSVPDEEASTADLTITGPMLPSLTDSDPETAWENYFAQIESSDESVVEQSRLLVQDTVRKLLRTAKTGLEKGQDAAKRDAGLQANRNIIAIIESALRHQQMQLWMYEALATSLYVADAPQEEIARAIFSAADLCNDPLNLVLIAQFADGLGDRATAIPLYQQVISAAPTLRPPYMRLLRIAVENRDAELIEWTTLAIARQVWDGTQGERLVQESQDASAALQDMWKREGKDKEAARYAAALAEASRRDCVIEVEWTGDALLSIAVAEPNGSTCWALAPRSLGGGVWEESSTATQSKVSYTCPVGFAGDYKLSILKDYGRVTDDSVKISLTTLENGKPVSQAKFFKLAKNGATVDINVPTGRRTEPLDEAIVATATASVLATQAATFEGAAIADFLDRASNAGIHAQISDSAAASGLTTGTGYQPTGASRDSVTPLEYYGYRRPYWGGGAVGYRPEIEWIPDGLQFYTSASATADRRYVIIPNAGMSLNTVDSGGTYTYVNGSGGSTNNNNTNRTTP
ncbi:MAG: VWA domain-containing protein [Thermoguttaceae bacterium]